MTQAIAHRGPDAVGIFVEGELSFGHRRLSIIDLSDAANQPFADRSGRYIIVFNGEIYNYEEIKALIPDYPFRTSSDTEVLLAAFIKWGPDCLAYTRGMFAFAIWDRQEKELFLARDRMGVKPIYYYVDENRLLFASELRALLVTGLIPRKLDTKSLLDYFTYQSFTYPDTAIEGVRQMEAGTWMKIKEGKVKKKIYWDVTKAAADFDCDDKESLHKRLRELLLQSVRRRLVSDVPVGAFLSGGIDSSAIVGLMAEVSPAPPNTFNISFEDKAFDESSYAAMVAAKFNTNHQRILLRPTVFLEELEHALDAMDSPSGDGINTYIVSQAINRSGIKVALSGIGGDELFAGYPFFDQYLQLQEKSWIWELPAGFRKFLTPSWIERPLNGKGVKIRQLLRMDGCTIDRAYPVFRQILSPALLDELTLLAPSTGNLPFLTQELADKRAALSELPLLSQVSAAEYLGYTQHTLLKDTDQMSMAHALEVREPFFDQDLVEFVLGIPDSYKKPQYPKSLLVEAIKPLLPDEIVFRKKQGFLLPWSRWLTHELRSFCELRITNMSRRPFIKGAALDRYWRRFLLGDKTVRWPEIWLFVVLEYWLEKNQVS
jgi:asparagine synthase (glutamine-hydrolysing)